jgi:hypothetical protein
MSVLVWPLTCTCEDPAKTMFNAPLVDARLFASPLYWAVMVHVPNGTVPLGICNCTVPFVKLLRYGGNWQFAELNMMLPVGGFGADDCTVTVSVTVEP